MGCQRLHFTRSGLADTLFRVEHIVAKHCAYPPGQFWVTIGVVPSAADRTNIGVILRQRIRRRVQTCAWKGLHLGKASQLHLDLALRKELSSSVFGAVVTARELQRRGGKTTSIREKNAQLGPKRWVSFSLEIFAFLRKASDAVASVSDGTNRSALGWF